MASVGLDGLRGGQSSIGGAEPSASCLGAAGRQGVRTWQAETEVMLHTSQGATGSWKRQEGPSPAASEGAQPC